MSAYLESNAELEKEKVKCLLNDYPEGLKIMEEIYNDIPRALYEGLIDSATVWEKFIEWSGRKKHSTGHGADFEDGTDAKYGSIKEWKMKKKRVVKGDYLLDRSTATITGVQKNGDLLIAVYDRWNKVNHYFQIPQDVIPNGTITIEFNHQTKECSSKWGEYKTSINNILNK
tara:strand:+ start:730 stop:1245 length:516 start_codon:yes stop_codon:yes gene_type:complete